MLKRVKIDRESLVHTAKSQPGSNKNQNADIWTLSISSDPNSLSSLPAVGVGGGSGFPAWKCGMFVVFGLTLIGGSGRSAEGVK